MTALVARWGHNVLLVGAGLLSVAIVLMAT